MASTAEGTTLTRLHRQQQLRLGREAIAEGLLLWRTVRADDLAGTADSWAALALRSILNYRRLSSLLAARYMQAFRVAEIGRPLPPGDGLVAIGNGAVLPRGATMFDEAVRSAITTALRINGPIALQKGIERGLAPQQAADGAFARVAGVTEKGVMDGGRETQTGLIRADRAVQAVARVTSGDACAFCTTLASRQFDYSSEKAASFKAHPGCACTTEVLYEGAEPNLPESSRKAAQQWADYLDDRANNPQRYEDLAQPKQAGPNRGDERSATDQNLLGFRRFLEGREGSQFRGDATGTTAPTSAAPGGSRAALAGEQTAARRSSVRSQLQQLRDRQSAATPQQRGFIDGRIAELEAELAAL